MFNTWKAIVVLCLLRHLLFPPAAAERGCSEVCVPKIVHGRREGTREEGRVKERECVVGGPHVRVCGILIMAKEGRVDLQWTNFYVTNMCF